MKIPIKELDARWSESKRVISLLPLLEYSLHEVKCAISDDFTITENDLSLMIEYSLTFESRHWALSAMGWMEQGFKINSSICEKLLAISKNKKETQMLRHKARTQANSWLRGKGI